MIKFTGSRYHHRLVRLATGLLASVTLVALGGSAVQAVNGDFTEYDTGANTTPYAPTIRPDGSIWFTEEMNHRISRLDPLTGELTNYNLPDGSYPQGITQGPDGNIWFTASGMNSVGWVDPANGDVTTFSLSTPGSRPTDITTGPDGKLWYTQLDANAIGTINPTTQQRSEYVIPTNNSGPKNITVGPDDALWFTESYGDKIGRLNPQTGVITEFSSGIPSGSRPWDITTGPDGSSIWFTLLEGNAIGRLSGSPGSITVFDVPTPSARPMGIAAGQFGELWFTEPGANQLGRIDLYGDIDEFEGLAAQSLPYYPTVSDDGGSVWFTQYRSRIGMMEVPRLLSPPVVSGSLEAGKPQQCVGEQWQTLGGSLPQPISVSWAVNESTVKGAITRSYTPAADDVGKSLTCTVSALYRKEGLEASATSEPVTVLAANTGPQGPPGATGATGATGQRGEPGTVQLVTCKQKSTKKGKKPTKKCTTTVVSGTVTFTTTGGARVSRATLLRGEHAYRARIALKGRHLRVLTPAVLPPGRYKVIMGRDVRRIWIG